MKPEAFEKLRQVIEVKAEEEEAKIDEFHRKHKVGGVRGGARGGGGEEGSTLNRLLPLWAAF